MDCTIIIAAYRPPQSLPEFIFKLMQRGFDDILLVDDGSGEKYQKFFSQCRRYGATVLSHKQNLGKGCALKTAFAYFGEHRNKKYIITADCDGQHQIDDIEKMFYTIKTDNDDILLGTRNFDHSTPLRSQIGNKIASRLFHFFYHLELSDTQTGLRGFSSAMLPQLLCISGARYEYEANVLIYAARHRIPIATTEIDNVYINANRSSHYRPLRDSLRITTAMAVDFRQKR